MDGTTVTRIADGVYRVEHDGGRSDLVYVAGPPGGWWAFANGQIFRGGLEKTPTDRRAARAFRPQALTAPMPATVIRVLVKRGAAVKKGDTVILLEAMKMELPIRAAADATVTAVHCREGQLVQPETTLVELE